MMIILWAHDVKYDVFTILKKLSRKGKAKVRFFFEKKWKKFEVLFFLLEKTIISSTFAFLKLKID